MSVCKHCPVNISAKSIYMWNGKNYARNWSLHITKNERVKRLFIWETGVIFMWRWEKLKRKAVNRNMFLGYLIFTSYFPAVAWAKIVIISHWDFCSACKFERKISENLCDPTVGHSFVLYKHDFLVIIQIVFTALEYMTMITESSNQCEFVTSCWTLNIAKKNVLSTESTW